MIQKLNVSAAKAKHRLPVRELVVVIDSDYSECLYINGKAWDYTSEPTVNASDLAEAAGEGPVTLRHTTIDRVHDEWPQRLEDALAPKGDRQQ